MTVDDLLSLSFTQIRTQCGRMPLWELMRIVGDLHDRHPWLGTLSDPVPADSWSPAHHDAESRCRLLANLVRPVWKNSRTHTHCFWQLFRATGTGWLALKRSPSEWLTFFARVADRALGSVSRRVYAHPDWWTLHPGQLKVVLEGYYHEYFREPELRDSDHLPAPTHKETHALNTVLGLSWEGGRRLLVAYHHMSIPSFGLDWYSTTAMSDLLNLYCELLVKLDSSTMKGDCA